MKSDAVAVRRRRRPVRPDRRLDHRHASRPARTRRRPPARRRRRPPAAPAASRARAALLDEARVAALKTVAEQKPNDARARAARQPLLRRRALRRRDQVVRARRFKLDPERLNVSTDLGVAYYYIEPAGQGARAVRPVAEHRSEARQDAAERRHRPGVRQAGSRRRGRGVAAGAGDRARQPREARRPSARSTASSPRIPTSGTGAKGASE